MRARLCMIVGVPALIAATSALGQAWQTVTSPDGRIAVDLAMDKGEVVYRARYDGKPILDRSRMGFWFKDAAPLDTGLDRFPISLHRNRRWRSSWRTPVVGRGRGCGRWRSRGREWCARRPCAGAP